MSLSQKINSFFKEVLVELKKVTWLTKNELLKYTLMVIVFTVVIASLLGALDYLFTYLIKVFVLNRG